jgi:hypothetical protein
MVFWTCSSEPTVGWNSFASQHSVWAFYRSGDREFVWL